jgi:prevent-host-death family protein
VARASSARSGCSHSDDALVYTLLVAVEVGVRELRSRLSYWLGRAAEGEEVIVTERGRPRARITPLGWEERRRQLIEQGVISPARTPKMPIDLDDLPEIRGGSLSDIVIEQRRAGY